LATFPTEKLLTRGPEPLIIAKVGKNQHAAAF